MGTFLVYDFEWEKFGRSGGHGVRKEPLVIAKGGHSGLYPDSNGIGICLPELNMHNCTDISNWYPNGAKNYTVNVNRSILSRSDKFDGFYQILTVDDLQQLKKLRLWLNIQHDKFYTDHKLNMTSYLLNITRTFAVGYVSSPELSFLRRVAPRLNDSNTQAVFRFLESGELEPSTG
ncbi:unnamed protein product [Spirodela intermedia]|uniref:glycerophosphodiester phosphodiesterase n=1 Tax=Spirodela intermedia TaxID=51605 RepID=A0A7I8KJI4_SPIIN|nr:unnamed protein product [Spirodela intermedia]